MTERSQASKTFWLLLSITLLGALLRYWGIDFGLPHTECRPDEPRIVHIAFSFFRGSLHPHFFDYPTLYMYMLFGVYGIYYAVGFTLGWFAGLQDIINLFFVDPRHFYLMARGLSAMLGTATIPMVYILTRQIFGRTSAPWGAFFMSVAYLHVRDSHFGVTDVPMTFFLTLSVVYILKSFRRPDERAYLMAGIFTGLTASIKYNGMMLGAPMLLTHLMVLQSENRLSVRHLVDRRICFFGLASIGAFALTSPFVVLDFKTFLPAFLREMNHLKQGHWNIVLERGWWYHARYTLFYGLGPAMLLAAAGGLVVGLRRHWRPACIALVFPLLYYCIAGRGYTVFLRYMLPVIPFICVFAAGFISRLCDRLMSHFSWGGRILLSVGVALMIVWQPLNAIFHLNSLLARTDNRVVAAKWIAATLPPSSSIYQCFWPRIDIEAPASQVRIYPLSETIETGFRKMIASGREVQIRQAKSDYLRTKAIPGFRQWLYDRQQDVFLEGNKAQAGMPDYIITARSALTWFEFPLPAALQPRLRMQYSLVKTFIAQDLSATARGWYDQQDAFHVPFAGFDNVQRPGPNIYIYKRD